MPQEQPDTQETIQKRKDFVPKLIELNEKVQIARHAGNVLVFPSATGA